MKAGKVKIKEMGLRDGHPEKDGVLVNIADLVPEVRKRILRKSNLEELVKEAAGLKVVGGIRGEKESVAAPEATTSEPEEKVEEQKTPVEAAKKVEETKAEEKVVSETEKPAEVSGDKSQEAIGAVPAS